MCSWSRAAQVPDRISDPQILDSFRFPGFPQQRSLSGGKQRRNSASSEEAPAAQLPRPGGVGCCVEKTAALSDLKTCTTSGICDSVLDSSVALPDALALSRGSPVQAVWTPRIASPGLARVRDIVHTVGLYNVLSLTLHLPELVPVRHGHPWPPEGPRPRRGAAASQIRPQSTGTRSGDLLRPPE